MLAKLRELIQSHTFDAAHVEHLRAAHFAPALQSLPRVIDAVDCITSLRRQIFETAHSPSQKVLSWEEWHKLRRYEPKAYRAFHRVAVTSPHDLSALVALAPTNLPPVEVIPNGVDTLYFSPKTDTFVDKNTLVFSGKLSYIANEDAARFLLLEILPRIRGVCPQAKLVLAGSSPSRALCDLAARAGNVQVTGYVSDLRPHIAGASVAVCPLRIGVGVQNKVLEAMAMARPVVATSLAARVLETQNRESGAYIIADGPDAIASACVGWLQNSTRAEQAGIHARQIVEDRFRWEATAQAFVRLYQNAQSDNQFNVLP
jgi:glycosyltransferase involved in cell wall biosynthesis